MTTAAAKLAEFGFTMDQGHAWLMANLSNPAGVLSVCTSAGVTNAMLGEVAVWPGTAYSAQEVQAFFQAHGLNSSALDAGDPGPAPGEGSVLLPATLDGFAPVLDFNDRAGALATATIRGQVLAHANPTITANYWNLFDPARFDGSADGVFTPEELGVSHLGTIQATAENIESLFYGTFIDVSTSIDFEEAGAIGLFFGSNFLGIVQRNPTVVDQYVDLFVQAAADPAALQAHPDAALASQLVVGMIGLSAGSGSQHNIFEQLLTI